MSSIRKHRRPELRGAGDARSDNREIRFEMEPKNLGLSDRELMGDLRRVARRLGTDAMTMGSYDRFGRVAAGTICKRFGGWNAALAAAKLKPVKRSRVTAEEIVEDFQRVARRLKSGSFSRTQYAIHGRFGATTVCRLFGTWIKAQHCAGLEGSRTSSTTTITDLFDNLEMLWLNLGRQPRGSDVCKPQSRFNLKTYKNRFGGIRNALRAFVKHKKQAGKSTGYRNGMTRAMNPRIHKTPRNVNWRLRYLIQRRDHFRCRACGRSPANDPRVELQVDHIVPWVCWGRDGGREFANALRTMQRWEGEHELNTDSLICLCVFGGVINMQALKITEFSALFMRYFLLLCV